jgi:hypothetical protein
VCGRSFRSVGDSQDGVGAGGALFPMAGVSGESNIATGTNATILSDIGACPAMAT